MYYSFGVKGGMGDTSSDVPLLDLTGGGGGGDGTGVNTPLLSLFGVAGEEPNAGILDQDVQLYSTGQVNGKSGSEGKGEGAGTNPYEYNIGYHYGKARSDRAASRSYSVSSDTSTEGTRSVKETARSQSLSLALSDELLSELSYNARTVGKNLEQMSESLKDFLQNATEKSAQNFVAVNEEIKGFSTIAKAAIDGNKRLVKKHVVFREKLIAARTLSGQIQSLKSLLTAIEDSIVSTADAPPAKT